ncbi:hypothetical protein FLP10_11205 [Agromyces intestinalis]|uniref:Uncharacterized protein n=1 Tax=Agromyces intestinalis TaxID=2592652 RepID=A0A5C1YIH8_9MICO|nr:hypothetical protein [Agromyces intestinalis]QEO14919.1 hypothetical protein FLP10_11205 [Agromyces intestinalis]
MTIFLASVLWGLALGLLLSAVVVGAGLVAQDFALHDYPPAIRERYGRPRSARGRRVARVAVILIGTVLIGCLVGCLLTTRWISGAPLDFVVASLSAGIALLTYNVWDFVVLDVLVFMLWTPALVVLPGTEGMPEYRDWVFHAIGFARGLVVVIVGAVLAGAAAVGVEAVAAMVA